MSLGVSAALCNRDHMTRVEWQTAWELGYKAGRMSAIEMWYQPHSITTSTASTSPNTVVYVSHLRAA